MQRSLTQLAELPGRSQAEREVSLLRSGSLPPSSLSPLSVLQQLSC